MILSAGTSMKNLPAVARLHAQVLVQTLVLTAQRKVGATPGTLRVTFTKRVNALRATTVGSLMVPLP